MLYVFSGVMKLCVHTIFSDKVSALLDSRDHHPLLYIYPVGLYTCSLQLLVWNPVLQQGCECPGPLGEWIVSPLEYSVV